VAPSSSSSSSSSFYCTLRVLKRGLRRNIFKWATKRNVRFSQLLWYSRPWNFSAEKSKAKKGKRYSFLRHFDIYTLVLLQHPPGKLRTRNYLDSHC
jgi:hypothetical protein